MASDTYAATWNSENLFYTMTTPIFPGFVQPEIAAATNYDHVMICCTRLSPYSGTLVIGQGYSMDAGETWTPLWDLTGISGFDEFSAALTANEGGGSWHLAWTSGQESTVMYSRRPQDLSNYWLSTPYAVNDTCTAGDDEYVDIKGIASNWDTDVACISWSDNRDGDLDYDCFVDFGDHTGLMTDRTGIVDDDGGTVNLILNPGVANAGRYYAVLGSATGTSPGTLLPGGYAVLPINWDVFTDFVLGNANVSPLFLNFIGQIKVTGMGSAQLNCPPIPGFSGIDLYFAFALNNLFNYASNSVKVTILP
ncbi:MAG: hypothetical protein ABIK28_14390 [Planctomycetota bacterium]